GGVVLERRLDGAQLLPALRGVLPDPRRGTALARDGGVARAAAARQPAGLDAAPRRHLRARARGQEAAAALPAGAARSPRRAPQRAREAGLQERGEDAPRAARGRGRRGARGAALAPRVSAGPPPLQARATAASRRAAHRAAGTHTLAAAHAAVST